MYTFGIIYLVSAFINAVFAIIEGEKFKRDFVRSFRANNEHWDAAQIATIVIIASIFIPVINTLVILYTIVMGCIQLIDKTKK